jgi:hypothetical protein
MCHALTEVYTLSGPIDAPPQCNENAHDLSGPNQNLGTIMNSTWL